MKRRGCPASAAGFVVRVCSRAVVLNWVAEVVLEVVARVAKEVARPVILTRVRS